MRGSAQRRVLAMIHFWYRDDEAPAVAEFFRDLADKRQETNDENIPALPMANLPMVDCS